MKYVNVRGCNGSGKTTLLRSFATDPGCYVDYVTVPNHKPIPVTYCPEGLALIGDYTPAVKAKTVGLDRVRTQVAARAAIELVGKKPEVRTILFEGIITSSVFNSWLEWSRNQGGMVWTFLDTPLDVCLERVRIRNGGKPFQEDVVAEKHRAVNRIRSKALAAGEIVADVHWETAHEDLLALINKLGSE